MLVAALLGPGTLTMPRKPRTNAQKSQENAQQACCGAARPWNACQGSQNSGKCLQITERCPTGLLRRCEALERLPRLAKLGKMPKDHKKMHNRLVAALRGPGTLAKARKTRKNRSEERHV